MCGIFGIVRYRGVGASNLQEGWKEKAERAIKHRGPDGKNWYESSKVDILHVRLSINDLSEKGTQPFVKRSSVTAVNGEIYNYPELKESLVKNGGMLLSHSDCEVVSEGYEAKGKGILQDIMGMYAGVIYDFKRSKIILFRDKMGKKPMYYYAENGEFVFCSEIKGIKSVLNNSPSICKIGLNFFLNLRYIPAPFTLYSGIKKLKPGEILEVDVDGGSVSSSLLHGNNIDETNVASKGVYRDLTEALQLRFMSDVDVGCLLSGGVDSGLIAALSTEELKRKMTCFTLRNMSEKVQEADIAKSIAEMYGHKLVDAVVPRSEEVLEAYKKILLHLDQPDTNLSILSMDVLTSLARNQGFKVLLTGDCADEVFLGYDRYLKMLLKGEGCIKNESSLIDYVESRGSSMASLAVDELRIDRESLNDQLKLLDYVSHDRSKSRLANFSNFDLQMWVAEQANYRSDLIGMKNSIELRSPFQDPRIVRYKTKVGVLGNYIATTPSLFVGKKAKLKAYAKKLLPPEVISRKKTGFSSILDDNINTMLNSLTGEYLSLDALKRVGVFNVDKIKGLVDSKREKKNIALLRHVLLTQMWFLENNISLE